MTDAATVEIVARTYESNLGRLRERHHVTETMHVLEFEGESEDLVTYVTLGLARLVLSQESGDVRQELLFDCHRRFASDQWVTLLAMVAGRLAIDGRAASAFEVVELDSVLRRLTGFAAVLCFAPIHHSEAIHQIVRTDPATLVVWLVPLHASEVKLAADKGWESLVSIFEERQPDLLDLKRKPVA